MAYELNGVLHKKFETEQKTDSFRSRDFIVKTEGDYPQLIKFQCTQDRCNMIDDYQEGDTLKVSFDLRGREWQDKYFTNLNAWRVEGKKKVQSDEVPPISAKDIPDQQEEEYDDLPF